VTPVEHVVAIGRVLDSLGIAWVLGGSLASSIVGEPRSTMGVDIAVRMEAERVASFVDAVRDDYYVDESMVNDAVLRCGSFNLIHSTTGMKIDLFALGDDVLDVRQLNRRELVEVDVGVSIWVGAADDQVLRKLRWFRMGGEVSERQWRDVVSILRVQGSRISVPELLAVAGPLGLAGLVERVVLDAFGDPEDQNRDVH